ncbi:hypothetical protein NPIL_611791 [Nephila pilipes]|uniref:Uncharacterized protein n=1 Tax=Nephila pilipes TaxID=299642 RepID=A0A8X6TX89_NEPPI|nr:hypothetical protein NPIL_611791 [Nephila pilipes]
METDEYRPVVLVISFDSGLSHVNIFDTERNCLSKAGPASPKYNFSFPIDTNGRSFTSNNYTRNLVLERRSQRAVSIIKRLGESYFGFRVKLLTLVMEEHVCVDRTRRHKHLLNILGATDRKTNKPKTYWCPELENLGIPLVNVRGQGYDIG